MGGTGGTPATLDTSGGKASALSAVPSWTGASPMATLDSSPTPTAPAPAANLGFPTATPTMAGPPPASAAGFTHTPYAQADTGLQRIGAAAPAAVAAAPAAAAAPTTSPDDWLYPGHLPMHFDTRASVAPTSGPGATAGGPFGMPWAYSATGPNQTAGYGAVGNFGGVAGYGPQQRGLEDQVLLPAMTAGTQLQDAQIDQYNRVRRADYDRYMRLYGVGYDLPAYQQALNGLVYPQNIAGQAGTGGG
jgi:hypothetical protein